MPINSIHFSGQVSHLTWKLKLNGFLGGELENLNKLKKNKNKIFFFLNPKMEGARLLALLIYFEGRGEGRGAIAPLKREALLCLVANVALCSPAGLGLSPKENVVTGSQLSNSG